MSKQAAVMALRVEGQRCDVGTPSGYLLHSQVFGRFGSAYHSAMRAFQDDLEVSLAHLKLPYVHRRHVRTTNFVERSFDEERRRAKVIPRFRTEKECLKLVFAYPLALQRAVAPDPVQRA